MYKLICLVCFRVGTEKPLIGDQRGKIGDVKSKMRALLGENRRLQDFFTRCWRQMERFRAIVETPDHRVSLNEDPHRIHRSDIRRAVNWMLEHAVEFAMMETRANGPSAGRM